MSDTHKLISNFEKLATTPSRIVALEIANAGLMAINAREVVKEQIRLEGNLLKIQNLDLDLNLYERIIVIGIGKVACSAGETLHEILGERISEGMILGTLDGYYGAIECVATTHPKPTEVNVAATKRLVAMLERAGQKDLILAFITGGGSSMMCYPNSVSCDEESRMISVMMDKGAPINEINTVRKHLSKVKGGWLAKYVHPRRMVAMLFSDVKGDDPSLIASGPTVYDETTLEMAMDLLNKYEVLQFCNLPQCELLETPKDRSIFANVDNLLLVNNQKAVEAMQKKALELGLEPIMINEYIQGEARVSGRKLLEKLTPGKAVIAAGETTVHITGSGKGGRNQELVMGSLDMMKPNQALISIASDGRDLTELAGAVGDVNTLKKSQELGLSVSDFLTNNDSTNFFNAVGDGIETGKLPSNVADLMVAVETV